MSIDDINEQLRVIAQQERMARMQQIQEQAAAARAARAASPRRVTRSMAFSSSSSSSSSSLPVTDKVLRMQQIQEQAAEARAARYNTNSLMVGGASRASMDAATMGKPYRCATSARGDFRFTADQIRDMAKKNGINNWDKADLDTLCKKMGIFNDVSLPVYRQQPAIPVMGSAVPGYLPVAPSAPYALPAVSSSSGWDRNAPLSARKQLSMQYAPAKAAQAYAANNPYQCNTKARGSNRFTRAELEIIARKVGIPKEDYSKMTMDALCNELGIYNVPSAAASVAASASSSDDYKHYAPPSYSIDSSAPIMGYASSSSSSSSSSTPDWSMAEDAGVYPSAPSVAAPVARSVSVVNPGEPRRSPIKRVRQDYSRM
jgi:hypothetical protein